MKILFQGDSITDAGRDRSDPHHLAGYPTYTAALLGGENEYLDLGISGDEVDYLLNRYDSDFKAVDPDVITILIGINDVWRAYDSNRYKSPQTFEAQYTTLLERIKADMPRAKLIIMEPFLLPAPDKAHWRPSLMQFIDVSRRMAVQYADGFIPLDGLFAKEQMTTPWQQLSADGVHPVLAGQQMIARYLAEEIRRVCGA